ncbi:50S ribosomal protein L19 [Candidatus Parcubacteria bacterium]|nr:50S ribosomal protein L19 [Candidatus Parcubacteria bacterium]
MEFTPVNTEARKKLGIKAGDTVRVMQKIEEKGKIRLQPFEGIVLSVKHGTEPGATFTVRRMSGGFGVEKIFPLFSPVIDSVEIIKRSKVRRSKLYYIRETAIKQIKKRMKMIFVSIKEEREEKQVENEEAPAESSDTPEAPKESPEETKAEEQEEESKPEENEKEDKKED